LEPTTHAGGTSKPIVSNGSSGIVENRAAGSFTTLS
jgi:hypothetical protein